MASVSSEFVWSGPADLVALQDALAPVYGLRAEPSARRTRTYYDTFDGGIRAAGLMVAHEAGELRVLRADGRPEATAPMARAPKRALLTDLPDGPVKEALRSPLDVRALLPLVRVTGRERLLRVLDGQEKTVVRLVLTEARVEDGPALSTRLSVIPVRGYDKAATRAGDLLREGLALDPAPRSLVDEAAAHTGHDPAGVPSGPAVARDPTERGAVAAATIAGHLLRVIEANLPGTLADIDSEFLHDLRVAVRRTRALQRELRGVFPAEALEHWRAEFRWLQQVTGPSRDLDVYILDFDDFREALPPARRADLEPLHDLLVRRRALELRRMRQALRGARTGAVLTGWAELLAAMERGEAGGADAERPIAELASARIARVHRQMVKTGGAIDDASPAVALHDLRKKGKELRYLLEFFAPLYPEPVVKPLVASLKALQNTLGRFQDREVQADLVHSLGEDVRRLDEGASALMAMGLLIERLHAGQLQARAEFAERFASFASAEQRALVKETFA